ncbi:hypothetical protein NHP21005_06740 [Helicobacter sp. NHP21005]|uniref:BspA family leucine-rich repeat surface protein n=1 Tax=Helicobacter felistomachi TaxID=3040201 RepID=UPI0025735523|nr:BspA family leucine-rich repeat surface protein [Helicobacter sp. NHP21005]BEG56986.1 hypothetical protein NHP21005_06740 [Helicobacter sp. NHP21005]
MAEQVYEKKYFPKSKEGLQRLIKDENIHLGEIEVGALTDLSELFKNSPRKNFEGLEFWDVSNVVDMSGMFCWCDDFNQLPDNWNVADEADITDMFACARIYANPQSTIFRPFKVPKLYKDRVYINMQPSLLFMTLCLKLNNPHSHKGKGGGMGGVGGGIVERYIAAHKGHA